MPGWDFRIQYDRLHLVTNNSRFLILPGWHRPNLASRLLSLCEQRLALAEAFRPPVVASGNLCRPGPLPRHDLSCGELAVSRPHARLSPLPRRLQAEHPQTRLRSPPGSERQNAVERHRTRPRLPSRRAQDHDQRRNDDCFTGLLRRYSRSPSGSGEAPSSCHCAGSCDRCRAVRHAQLPGHGGMGGGSWSEGTRTVPLQVSRKALSCTQHEHPTC